MNKGEINTGGSNENENVLKQSKLLTQKSYCQNLQGTSKHFNIEDLASDG
jgi:hypothetical protein